MQIIMNPLIKLSRLSRFVYNSKPSYSQIVTGGLTNGATGIQVDRYPAEVISRKGILVPVHISIYQILSLYWLEMVVIVTSLLRISSSPAKLNKAVVNNVFSIDAYNVSRKLVRRCESTQPARINKHYNTVRVNYAHLQWLGIYEELHIVIPERRPLKIIQPCVVVCHRFDTDWREVLTKTRRVEEITGAILKDSYLNPDKVKCYVAIEFDKVYTWDKPMREYFKKMVVPMMNELNIEIVYMPMVELRNSIMHTPDFSQINPFKGTNKIKMDVKTSRNYYSPI